MESGHCAQCRGDIEKRHSYRTPRGELLCGPCYLYVYGPRRRRSQPSVGVRVGVPRRPMRIRPVWLTPSSAELRP